MGLGQAWRSAPPAIRFWTMPAIITAFSLLFGFAADAGRLALRFDRDGISGGEFWRLLTGHFVHLGWAHWVLNVLGLILVWSICGRAFSVRGWFLLLLLVVVGIDAGLWLLDPGLEWYVGLSGLLHGMLLAGIVVLSLAGSRDLLVLGLLVAAKVVWEQLNGPLPGSEGLAGDAVVVNAHLYGALSGALSGVAAALLIRARRDAPI